MARRRKRSLLRRLGVFVGVLLLCVAVLFLVYDAKMRPAVRVMALSQAQDIATRIINESVARQLPVYGKLVDISSSEDGRVRAVRVESAALNGLKSAVALDVLHELHDIDGETLVELPVGALLGSEFFSARGPKLPVRILPVTSVFTEVQSELSGVGVNQTRHRIVLTVTVTATLILPTEMAEMTYAVDVVCADTVILGDVPEVYAVFESDGDRIKDKVIIP